MKPFNLETVLKHRKRAKDLAMNRFHKAQGQYISTKNELDNKQKEYQSLVTSIESLETQGIDVTEHIRYQHRIEFIAQELSHLGKKLKKQNELVVRERALLAKKGKEQQVMEKLKEKQNAEYRKFIDKKESAMLDEMAVLHRNNK